MFNDMRPINKNILLSVGLFHTSRNTIVVVYPNKNEVTPSKNDFFIKII